MPSNRGREIVRLLNKKVGLEIGTKLVENKIRPIKPRHGLGASGSENQKNLDSILIRSQRLV
jgi:hypothetical protein